MKTIHGLSYILSALFFLATGSANAAIHQFVGNFTNVDPNTRGITKLKLINKGNGKLDIRVFGKCHPTDCPWGVEDAYAYASTVSENIHAKAKSITAIYTKNFKETILLIKPLGQHFLSVDALTRFTDGSGRTAYHQTYRLKKRTIVGRRPDLVVRKIFNPKWNHARRRSEIKVTIRNIGSAVAAPSLARLIDPSTKQPTGAPYNSVRSVPALAPGASHTVLFTLPYWVYNPDASLTATADYKKQVPESNETNNRKKFQGLG